MARKEDRAPPKRSPSVLVSFMFCLCPRFEFLEALRHIHIAAMSSSRNSRTNAAKVTDSRNLLTGSKRSANPKSSGLVSLDNVLQHTSDVPSMHSRYPQDAISRSTHQERSSSRFKRLNSTPSRLRAAPSSGAARLTARPRLPPRTTKITEKLVLLPETVPEEEDESDSDDAGEGRLVPMDEDKQRQRAITRRQRMRGSDFDEDNESAPLLAEEEALRKRRVSAEKAKSYAERLPKARRAEKLPRVTAYCTAQAYKLGATAEFVKEYHGARTKLYDDCLYAAYHLPLLPGINGYRLRSSPPVKTVGGKAVLDEEIERNERRDYHEEYLDDAHEDEHSVAGSYDPDYRKDRDQADAQEDGEQQQQQQHRSRRAEPSKPAHIPPNALHFAEMFVFSYGVVVFWNFTAHQEKDVLADLAFYSSDCLHHRESKRRRLPISLITNALPEEDFETEEFHFEYSTEISRPRVYNDMITLRSGDHMIKLAISHGIAQSTKLSFFEEVMAKQMDEAKDVPKRLALTGKLGMKREEMYRILGKLFKSRVEVNLCKFPALYLDTNN